MDEQLLTRISLAITVIGFCSLILVFIFVKPEDISFIDELPSDTLVRFQAEISSIYPTSSGSMLTFEKTCSTRGFIGENVSSAFESVVVDVVAKKSGDFVQILSLTPHNSSSG